LCGGILLLCICLALGIIYFLKIAKPKKPGNASIPIDFWLSITIMLLPVIRSKKGYF
jgi:hypothetical protein